MEKSVLFICSGNTCRSPLAEAWFNKRAPELGVEHVIACSAGLYALPGDRASVNSQTVAGEYGVSLADFCSQPLTLDLLNGAVLIVGMTEDHCRKIVSAVPEVAGKVKRLLEFADGGDVCDPYGGALEDYRVCFKNMMLAIDNLILQLKDKQILNNN